MADAREPMGAHMVEQLSKELKKSATLNVSDAVGVPAPVFKQVGGGKKAARAQAEAVALGVQEAGGDGDEEEDGSGEDGGGGEEEAAEEGLDTLEMPVENFEEACERASGVMGYPIDDFQQVRSRVKLSMKNRDDAY